MLENIVVFFREIKIKLYTKIDIKKTKKRRLKGGVKRDQRDKKWTKSRLKRDKK